MTTTDDLGDPVPLPENEPMIRKLIKFGLVWPFLVPPLAALTAYLATRAAARRMLRGMR